MHSFLDLFCVFPIRLGGELEHGCILACPFHDHVMKNFAFLPFLCFMFLQRKMSLGMSLFFEDSSVYYYLFTKSLGTNNLSYDNNSGMVSIIHSITKYYKLMP